MDRVVDRPVLSGYTDLEKGDRTVEALFIVISGSRSVKLCAFATIACIEGRMWISCRWPNPSVN